MIEKRWLTKDEKRLLKPHAEHYQAMYEHLSNATMDYLYLLQGACTACTEINCGWHEYEAAQHLKGEILREVGWRNRHSTEAAELTEPTVHIESRWADDGGALPNTEHRNKARA